jgi:hypothetical protein
MTCKHPHMVVNKNRVQCMKCGAIIETGGTKPISHEPTLEDALDEEWVGDDVGPYKSRNERMHDEERD